MIGFYNNEAFAPLEAAKARAFLPYDGGVDEDSPSPNPTEDTSLVIVSVIISPGPCQPSLSISALNELFKIAVEIGQESSILLLGDFNTGRHGPIVRSWAGAKGLLCLNVPSRPTCGQACLDYAFVWPGKVIPACFITNEVRVASDNFATGSVFEPAAGLPNFEEAHNEDLFENEGFPFYTKTLPWASSDHCMLTGSIPVRVEGYIKDPGYKLDDLTMDQKGLL